ncbi:MAG TPA: hypothetical protein VGO50_06230 [Pyrinomonadaceae bacterium]|jgi:hypothetical protein|nr:hypothetical protein [Pyrinomonadaceae bacterium]
MARALVLSLDGEEFPVQLQKIDRERLYGNIEIEAFDEDGNEAYLQILDSDGKTLIATGGTSLATLDEDGNSVDRKKLIPITSEGEEIEPVSSSFSAPNLLYEATIDEYLSHTVKSVYVLTPPEGTDFDLLEDVLSGDSIYKFDFSYRGGLDYDTAFLVGNDKTVFMIIGVNSNLQFVKLNQPSVLEPVEEQEISGEEIEFDLF